MKLKSVLVMIISLLASGILFSEIGHVNLNPDGTLKNKQDVYSFSTDPEYLKTFEPITFNIFFWSIQDDNGEYQTTGSKDVHASVAKLNETYNQFNVYFNLAGVDTTSINSLDSHRKNSLGGIVAYAKKNGSFKVNALNVYVPSYLRQGGGQASMNSNYCAVGAAAIRDYQTRTTLPHEIAHVFNIHHTRSLNENVTRDTTDTNYNATKTGDYVVDTAANPGFYKYTEPTYPFLDFDSCTYNGNETDRTGMPYKIVHEDVINLMSDANGCLEKVLTTGQKIRIRESIRADRDSVFSRAQFIK